MKCDPEVSVAIDNVAKRIFYLLLSSVGSREEVIAHGHGHVALDDCVDVLEANGGPSFDREAFVFRTRAIGGDKLGKRLVVVGSELNILGESWLEQNGGRRVGVQGVDVLSGNFLEVATVFVRRRDANDPVAPGFLRSFNLVFRDGHHVSEWALA